MSVKTAALVAIVLWIFLRIKAQIQVLSGSNIKTEFVLILFNND